MVGSIPAIPVSLMVAKPVLAARKVMGREGLKGRGSFSREGFNAPSGTISYQAVCALLRMGGFSILESNMSNVDPDFWEEEEDVWEDSHTYQSILSQLPDGWSLVRVMAGWTKLAEMREWLEENAQGPYREVNWSNGGCSYSMGVMLEHEMDIVLFKLRWG